MSEIDDPYAELGVDKKASKRDIEQQFRKLAKQRHPDVNSGDPKAEAKFRQLVRAKNVLINPTERDYFDKTGKVRDNNVDESQAEARSLLAMWLETIINEVPSSQDPEDADYIASQPDKKSFEQIDFISSLKDCIAEKRTIIAKNKKMLRKSKKKFKSAHKRIKFKKVAGNDFIHQTLEHKMRLIEQNLFNLRHHTEICDVADGILLDYECDFEKFEARPKPAKGFASFKIDLTSGRMYP